MTTTPRPWPRRAAPPSTPASTLTRVPGIPKLDFRVEAPSTTPLGLDQGGIFIYINSQYLSGNTNYGNLLGNSVGRDARAIEAWSTYWFSPRNEDRAGLPPLERQREIPPRRLHAVRCLASEFVRRGPRLVRQSLRAVREVLRSAPRPSPQQSERLGAIDLGTEPPDFRKKELK